MRREEIELPEIDRVGRRVELLATELLRTLGLLPHEGESRPVQHFHRVEVSYREVLRELGSGIPNDLLDDLMSNDAVLIAGSPYASFAETPSILAEAFSVVSGRVGSLRPGSGTRPVQEIWRDLAASSRQFSEIIHRARNGDLANPSFPRLFESGLLRHSFAIIYRTKFRQGDLPEWNFTTGIGRSLLGQAHDGTVGYFHGILHTFMDGRWVETAHRLSGKGGTELQHGGNHE